MRYHVSNLVLNRVHITYAAFPFDILGEVDRVDVQTGRASLRQCIVVSKDLKVSHA